MVTRIVITGCCGRMGSRIGALALSDEEIEIFGAVETKTHPDVGKDFGNIIGDDDIGIQISGDLSQVAKGADAIIDFTTPTATVSNLGVANKLKIPIVIGTTGLTDEEMQVARHISKSIPVLISPNMSIGVNIVFKIVADITSMLGEGYDIEICEAHHNKKKDAPSGTAKRLAELIAEVKGKKLSDIAVYGRHGNTGQRRKGELGIHSLRAGNIIGDHTVIYSGTNDTIKISHSAHSRDILAQGAILAVKFIADRSPGLYSMQDVIGGL